MFYKIENGQITNRADQPLDAGDWRLAVIGPRSPFDPVTQKETPSFSIQSDHVDVTYAYSANADGIALQQRLTGINADSNVLALLTQAQTATNAQIDTWLTSNVTTLAQARTVLGALIKIVATRVAL